MFKEKEITKLEWPVDDLNIIQTIQMAKENLNDYQNQLIIVIRMRRPTCTIMHELELLICYLFNSLD